MDEELLALRTARRLLAAKLVQERTTVLRQAQQIEAMKAHADSTRVPHAVRKLEIEPDEMARCVNRPFLSPVSCSTFAHVSFEIKLDELFNQSLLREN